MGCGNRSNESPCPWHQWQLKEWAKFLIIRSWTLSFTPLWVGVLIWWFSLLAKKKGCQVFWCCYYVLLQKKHSLLCFDFPSGVNSTFQRWLSIASRLCESVTAKLLRLRFSNGSQSDQAHLNAFKRCKLIFHSNNEIVKAKYLFVTIGELKWTLVFSSNVLITFHWRNWP